MTSGQAHPEVRRVTARAISRLNALEYVILGVTMLLALFAGALVARMVEMMTGEPSRLAWALSSLLFFIVPGWVVLKREREAEKARAGEADSDAAAGSGAAAGSDVDTDAGSNRDAVQLESVTEESDHGRR